MATVTRLHIVSDPTVCEGSRRVEDIRITVRTVVTATLLHGQTAEQLFQHYPHLPLAAMHGARSYCYDHREVMDREIAEHEVLDPGFNDTSVR